MDRLNIILTGFMGTGKTTVGKLLAQKLGYTFVDTDHHIEKKLNINIAEYFKKYGENSFRSLETKIAEELSSKKSLVIGTGGGMMLNPVISNLLAQSGHIFCLVATAEEIFHRVSKDQKTIRPLLTGSNPMERIVSLLQQRKKSYDQFTQITTTGKKPAEVAGEILRYL